MVRLLSELWLLKLKFEFRSHQSIRPTALLFIKRCSFSFGWPKFFFVYEHPLWDVKRLWKSVSTAITVFIIESSSNALQLKSGYGQGTKYVMVLNVVVVLILVLLLCHAPCWFFRLWSGWLRNMSSNNLIGGWVTGWKYLNKVCFPYYKWCNLCPLV